MAKDTRWSGPITREPSTAARRANPGMPRRVRRLLRNHEAVAQLDDVPHGLLEEWSEAGLADTADEAVLDSLD